MHPDTQTEMQTDLRRRFRSVVLALTAVAALAMLAVVLYAPMPAQAQTLPYKAYGSGRVAGEVVRVLKGSTQVGQATVTSAGTWDMSILAGGAANLANGDAIGFSVDGRPAAETVTFGTGLFSTPPGLTLTVSAATPTPTPTATPAAGRGRLAATPVFDSTGRALAVFTGGTVNELGVAATDSRASGVWVQDASGAFHLYIVGGPAFLGDDFRAKFPGGFASATSVLLVK